MKKSLFTLVLITSIHFIYAIGLEKSMWHDFTGKIGNAQIQLSIYISADGQVNGNYCYKKFEKKIYLSGTIKDNTFDFTELIEDNPNGYLKGTILSADNIKFEGTWTNFEKNKSLSLVLQHMASCGGTLEHRYEGVYGADTDIETFMKQVKKSILNKDIDWMLNHITFPIRVTLYGKQQSIKNKTQFNEHYDAIFHQEFQNKIKTACICNLFVNSQGIMLGDGEIWINNRLGSTDKKYSFSIISINN